MIGISIKGLIALWNRGWAIEVGKPSKEDKKQRRAPAITMHYLDKDRDNAMESITIVPKPRD